MKRQKRALLVAAVWIVAALNQPLWLGTAVADSQFGSNGSNVNIPDNDGWVSSTITISGAPVGSRVTGIDVHFSCIHTYSEDLIVDLNDQNFSQDYNLW